MGTLSIDISIPVSRRTDTDPNGRYTVVGETLPMLLCGVGDARKHLDAALFDFVTHIARNGPDALADYLTARGVDYHIVREEGRETRRETQQLELAVSV